MILYFSGTGNSEYVAKRIGQAIGDEVVDLFGKIKTRDCSDMRSERPWVIVVPTYAWRIPRIVRDWISHTRLAGSDRIYFVMTCGSGIGNAGKYLARLCDERKMTYCGCVGIVMPENYIALFETPTEAVALRIIGIADRAIDRVAATIGIGEPLPESRVTLAGRMCSGIVNAAFYPLFVHAGKFRVTQSCVSCGKCSDVCALGNIALVDGKPTWGKNCTHCMACINRCPVRAIEYGRHSKNLPRYVFPKKIYL